MLRTLLKVFSFNNECIGFLRGQARAIINTADENGYSEAPKNNYFDEEHNRTRLCEIK